MRTINFQSGPGVDYNDMSNKSFEADPVAKNYGLGNDPTGWVEAHAGDSVGRRVPLLFEGKITRLQRMKCHCAIFTSDWFIG